MGKSSPPPAVQTVTQKTEIDPIQKSFLFGTPLPADYKAAVMARNRRIAGPDPNAAPMGDLNTLEGRLAAGLLVEEPSFLSAQYKEAGIPSPYPQIYRDPVTGAQYRSAPYGGVSPYGGSSLTPYTSYDRDRERIDAKAANGGIIALAAGGMVPQQLPDFGNKELAHYYAIQAMQDRQAMQPPQQQFAMGGMIEGPGTGTSDDIPATIYQNGIPVGQAALSNGEVVLSRKDLENMDPEGDADRAANMVGNAPNGTRGQAAAQMYAMMNRFRNGGGMG